MRSEPLLTVTVPCHPPPEASPNWHGHWRRKASAVKVYRAMGNMSAVSITAGCPQDTLRGPLRVETTIRWGKGRKRADSDNAGILAKACLDGIAEALGTDDRRWTVTTTQERDPTGVGETVVKLWQEDAT